MEINKYKANIYTDFTISSFHHPTTHSPLKSTATLAPRPTLPKPHYPSKIANTLASLVKGEVLSPEKIRATTGGIVTPTSRPAPALPKTALSFALHYHTCLPSKKGRCCRPKKFGRLPEGLLSIPTINEIFRTITIAFRRASVCVCLVGFASIAIVVVCGRCVLHRLFATTCKHPCLKPLGTHA